MSVIPQTCSSQTVDWEAYGSLFLQLWKVGCHSVLLVRHFKSSSLASCPVQLIFWHVSCHERDLASGIYLLSPKTLSPKYHDNDEDFFLSYHSFSKSPNFLLPQQVSIKKSDHALEDFLGSVLSYLPASPSMLH